MDEDPAFELRMLYGLAQARAVYGNGEGLAIAGDLDLCYWCQQPKPCNVDHSAQKQALLDENLETELAKLGLLYDC